VIYSYNKNQRDALFLRFILVEFYTKLILEIVHLVGFYYKNIPLCCMNQLVL